MYVCINVNKKWKDLLLYSLILTIAVPVCSEFPLPRKIWAQQGAGELVKAAVVEN